MSDHCVNEVVVVEALQKYIENFISELRMVVDKLIWHGVLDEIKLEDDERQS